MKLVMAAVLAFLACATLTHASSVIIVSGNAKILTLADLKAVNDPPKIGEHKGVESNEDMLIFKEKENYITQNPLKVNMPPDDETGLGAYQTGDNLPFETLPAGTCLTSWLVYQDMVGNRDTGLSELKNSVDLMFDTKVLGVMALRDDNGAAFKAGNAEVGHPDVTYVDNTFDTSSQWDKGDAVQLTAMNKLAIVSRVIPKYSDYKRVYVMCDAGSGAGAGECDDVDCTVTRTYTEGTTTYHASTADLDNECCKTKVCLSFPMGPPSGGGGPTDRKFCVPLSQTKDSCGGGTSDEFAFIFTGEHENNDLDSCRAVFVDNTASYVTTTNEAAMAGTLEWFDRSDKSPSCPLTGTRWLLSLKMIPDPSGSPFKQGSCQKDTAAWKYWVPDSTMPARLIGASPNVVGHTITLTLDPDHSFQEGPGAHLKSAAYGASAWWKAMLTQCPDSGCNTAYFKNSNGAAEGSMLGHGDINVEITCPTPGPSPGPGGNPKCVGDGVGPGLVGKELYRILDHGQGDKGSNYGLRFDNLIDGSGPVIFSFEQNDSLVYQRVVGTGLRLYGYIWGGKITNSKTNGEATFTSSPAPSRYFVDMVIDGLVANAPEDWHVPNNGAMLTGDGVLVPIDRNDGVVNLQWKHNGNYFYRTGKNFKTPQASNVGFAAWVFGDDGKTGTRDFLAEFGPCVSSGTFQDYKVRAHYETLCAKLNRNVGVLNNFECGPCLDGFAVPAGSFSNKPCLPPQ